MIQDDFIFDGESLRSHGYLISATNSVDESIVASNMEYQTIKAPRSDVTRKIGDEYPETYTRTISITKDNCVWGDDNLYLTNDDISEMTKWLCRKTYKWFRWNSENAEDIYDEVWYEVMFDVNNAELGGKVTDLELTIKTNRPYGVTRIIKNEWNSADEPSKMIGVHSDEEGYIYPNMTITVVQGGNLEIINTAEGTEGRKTEFKNCTAGEVIRIYGEDVLQVSSSNSEHNLADDFNYKFPRLLNEYRNSKNTFEINKEVEVIMEYRGIRKVGI